MKYKIIALLLSFVLIALWSCKSVSQVLPPPTDPVIDSLEQEILGTWVLENDSSSKIKFENNESLKYYSGSTLMNTATYEITASCDGELQGNGTYFLKTYPNQGGFTCNYIENINYNGNNRMVLMTKNQGKIIVYLRP